MYEKIPPYVFFVILSEVIIPGVYHCDLLFFLKYLLSPLCAGSWYFLSF